jgi:hypothetical protein
VQQPVRGRAAPRRRQGVRRPQQAAAGNDGVVDLTLNSEEE